jgi:hypothetical protein
MWAENAKAKEEEDRLHEQMGAIFERTVDGIVAYKYPLLALQEARAFELKDNKDLVAICNLLVENHHQHPFKIFFPNLLSEDQYLLFLQKAKWQGFSLENDMASLEALSEIFDRQKSGALISPRPIEVRNKCDELIFSGRKLYETLKSGEHETERLIEWRNELKAFAVKQFSIKQNVFLFESLTKAAEIAITGAEMQGASAGHVRIVADFGAVLERLKSLRDEIRD